MKKYIKKASQMGVKFLVFPELCLTGYVSSDDPKSQEYKMILKQAETTGGKTAKAVSSLAVSNQMWIVYGAPKK